MEWAYDVNGGAPIIKKYHASAAIANAGVPIDASTAGEHGVLACTTTAAINTVGLSADTCSAPSATNGDSSSDPASFISIIVNPGGIYRARLSGGATEGTALTIATADTPNTDGDVTEGGVMLDESVIWGYSGANVGQYRRSTGTDGEVEVAWRYDIATGDEFLQAPIWPLTEQLFPQLTTLLTEIDASAAIDTDNDNFRCVDVDLRDKSDNGRTNSYAYLLPVTHFFASNTTVA